MDIVTWGQSEDGVNASETLFEYGELSLGGGGELEALALASLVAGVLAGDEPAELGDVVLLKVGLEERPGAGHHVLAAVASIREGLLLVGVLGDDGEDLAGADLARVVLGRVLPEAGPVADGVAADQLTITLRGDDVGARLEGVVAGAGDVELVRRHAICYRSGFWKNPAKYNSGKIGPGKIFTIIAQDSNKEKSFSDARDRCENMMAGSRPLLKADLEQDDVTELSWLIPSQDSGYEAGKGKGFKFSPATKTQLTCVIVSV
jgi:hypothetical protein